MCPILCMRGVRAHAVADCGLASCRFQRSGRWHSGGDDSCICRRVHAPRGELAIIINSIIASLVGVLLC